MTARSQCPSSSSSRALRNSPEPAQAAVSATSTVSAAVTAAVQPLLQDFIGGFSLLQADLSRSSIGRDPDAAALGLGIPPESRVHSPVSHVPQYLLFQQHLA